MDYAALAQMAGAIAGEIGSASSEAEAKAILRDALSKFDEIEAPILEKIIAEQLAPTEMESLKADPTLRGYQMDALRRMSEVADQGGMTLEDKANLADIQREGMFQEKVGREAIRERMAATGGGGGGVELAMQLHGNQAQADRSGREGLRVAAMAQKRALEAMMAKGDMARGMEGQDFSQRSRAAEAADMRNRFNASSRDKAQYYNKGLPQQQFDNQYRLAAGRSGQANTVAKAGYQDAQNSRLMWNNIGTAGAESFKEDPNSPEAIQRRANQYADGQDAYEQRRIDNRRRRKEKDLESWGGGGV